MFCEFPSSTVEMRVNGAFAPCCKWRNDLYDGARRRTVFTETALEFYRSAEMKAIRDHFQTKQEFLPGCSECRLAEAAGFPSTRQTGRGLAHAENFPTRFEVKLGNLCNLACRICDPLSSIKWVGELAAQNLIEADDFKSCKSGKIWSTENSRDHFLKMLPHLREIYFTGGEPLIEKEHVDMLEMAIDSGAASNIRLMYNSNGTVFNPKLIQYWEQFENVELKFSIDDVGSRYEYERYGANWNRVQENLVAYERLAKSRTNMRVGIWLTVSLFNMHYLDEILNELQAVVPTMQVNLSPLYLPHHYSVKVLPPALKAATAAKLAGDDRFESIVQYMLADDWTEHLESARTTIDRDDRFRKQSFAATFPELAAHF